MAALTGIGAVVLWRLARRPGWAGSLLPAALLTGAAAQLYLLQAYPEWSVWLVPVLLGLCLAGVVLDVIARLRPRLARRLRTAAVALSLAGLLLTPAVWSGLTVARGDGGGMPSGGPAAFRSFARTRTAQSAAAVTAFPGLPDGAAPLEGFAPPPGGPPPGGFPGAENSANVSSLIAYLEANRDYSRFLLAVPNSMSASSIIINTGQPVMAMGGFSGGDPILTVGDLAQDVHAGVVRYFLLQGTVRPTPLDSAASRAQSGAFGPPPAPGGTLAQPGAVEAGPPPFPGGPGGFGTQGELQSWVTANCRAVPSSEWQTGAVTPATGFGGAQQLYDCAGNAATS